MFNSPYSYPKAEEMFLPRLVAASLTDFGTFLWNVSTAASIASLTKSGSEVFCCLTILGSSVLCFESTCLVFLVVDESVTLPFLLNASVSFVTLVFLDSKSAILSFTVLL